MSQALPKSDTADADGGWNDSASRCRMPSVAALGVVAAMLLLLSVAAQAADCAVPVAHLVLVKGNVELVRQGTTRLVVAETHAEICPGDSVLVHQRSQAALLLANATVVRLDQGTVLTVSPSSGGRAPLLDVVSGAIYVISRTPRPFRVKTPYINANVEGTEFLVEVQRESAAFADPSCPRDAGAASRQPDTDRITVYEGRVRASDDAGTADIILVAGESAAATASTGLVRDVVVRPRDAVVWTLHVEPVISSAQASRPVIACASRLLAVGRIDEAKRKLEAALPADVLQGRPTDAVAYALLATIAVAQGDKTTANLYSELATRLDSASATAWIARSYAQQADFRIADALASVRRANSISPDASRKARLAELELAIGDSDAALAAATDAARSDPNLSRAHSVVGFVRLVRLETQGARDSFETAIRLDTADPLPRLGLGLAKIREGDLAGGRQEIEVAAILDTESSLVRSYLGKAYFEERRDRLAEAQFALAKDFDPRDPTPWLYGAILKQLENRPAEALVDIQKSIQLNDNRAVYRSRLLLDQDQAARRVSLARTYRAIGFDQLALLEAVKSLSLEPGDASAHRFLSDAYNGQVRSEGARVGELFQSQLRQPLGLNTISPELLTDRRQVFAELGPVQASSHEFTPLFGRDQFAVKVDGLFGTHRTLGEQVFASVLTGNIAYSVGQYHYETKGLRENNDLKRGTYDAFLQVGLTPALRIQAELRDDSSSQGDLSLRFDSDDFSRNLRDEFKRRSARVGGIFVFDQGSNLVVSALSGTSRERLFAKPDPDNFFEDHEHIDAGEIQYLHKTAAWHLTTGFATYLNRVVLEDPGGSANSDEKGHSLYALAVFTSLPWGLRPVVGLSQDTFEQAGFRVSKTNPKFGLLWTLSSDTTLRATWFKTIKRSFDANQTLQPSQVLGFNQVFDDPNGTLSRRLGVALHHAFSTKTFAGAEVSARKSKVPNFPGEPYSDWNERFAKAYVYRVLNTRTTLTTELQYERLQRPEDNPGNEAFTDIRSVIVPLALRFNGPTTWSAVLEAIYVNQRVRYVDPANDVVDGKSGLVVANVSLAYQFASRNASVSVEAKNLFDRRFRYQEIDAFSAPRISPRRTLLARMSASF